LRKKEMIDMTWKDEIRKKEEFGKPLPKSIEQLCDKCGKMITMPKGAIYGQDNSKFCDACRKE
jgi:hypothetical protein